MCLCWGFVVDIISALVTNQEDYIKESLCVKYCPFIFFYSINIYIFIVNLFWWEGNIFFSYIIFFQYNEILKRENFWKTNFCLLYMKKNISIHLLKQVCKEKVFTRRSICTGFCCNLLKGSLTFQREIISPSSFTGSALTIIKVQQHKLY